MSLNKFIQYSFRSSKSFNWFFIFCFSLGVLGVILVESFKVGIDEKITKNAKNFIASDLYASTRRDFNDAEKKIFENLEKEKGLKSAKWISTYSLVSTDKKSKLADLNFVSKEFPFYGQVIFDDKKTSSNEDWKELTLNNSIWVSIDLIWELDIKNGEKIKIGEEWFTVKRIIAEDQFSSFRGFSLAPVIFVSTENLEKTKLIQFGSTAFFGHLFKFPDNVSSEEIDLVKKDLREKIIDKTVKVQGPKESSEQISRSLNYLSDYLGLVTLLTYILSLIGLYYFTHYFLSKGLRNIAILKALGLRPRKIFFVQAIHLSLLSIFALILSFIIMAIFLPLFQNIISEKIGENFPLVMNSFVFLRVAAFSVIGCLLVLLPLVYAAVQIPVNTILQDLPKELKNIGFIYYVPLFIYVIAMAIFLSHSIKIGLVFIGSLIGLCLFSFIFFKLGTIVLEKFGKKQTLILKHGILSLVRYFNSSFTIFTSLMLGLTLIVLITQMESSLKEEFVSANADRRPDIFLFDLQDSQHEAFNQLVKNNNIQLSQLSPMIRGRLIKINDKEVERKNLEEEKFTTREEENEERFKTRGINLSYKDQLSWSESLIEGKWFNNKCDESIAICEVSLEESYARRMNVKMGDILTFDVSSIEVKGKITSIRKIKWTSFEPNFFIIFQPGVLDEAPKTFLGGIKIKSEDEKKKIFKLIGDNFSNVSLLEVAQVIQKITKVFNVMSFAIKTIAILALFVALVVVLAVSFNHIEHKAAEMRLFYFFGISKKKRFKIFFFENAFIVVSCVLLSLFSGSLLTYLVLSFGFSIASNFSLAMLIGMMTFIGLALSLLISFKIRRLIDVTEVRQLN